MSGDISGDLSADIG